MESTRPFAETLQALMDIQGIGQRELSRRCERKNWGAISTIGLLVRGELRPSMKAMEAVAEALGEDPQTFAEYRLGKARERFDPDAVGLQQALRNLAQLPRE